jgi:formylglycine-generating enzyme required for sulfatase activity
MRVFFLIGLFLIIHLSVASGQKRVGKIPGSTITFEMVLIQNGIHQVDENEVHLDSFWIGSHEVTFDEYILFQDVKYDSDVTAAEVPFDADAIARPSPPYEDFSKGMGRKGGFPAVSMTQQSALEYCHWLYKKTGIFYRLPTEAEWEYTCLKGKTDAKNEDELDSSAWYYDNSFEKYQKTGEKKSNELDVFDMLGNVAEWTADYYLTEKDYLRFLKDSTDTNPWIVPLRRHSRTVKGGSYDDNPEDCTCKARLKSKARWQARDPQIPKSRWWNPDSPFVGFRIVQPVHQLSKAEVEAYFEKAIKY